MKLLIIRHGDPDYVNDTLTEVGKKEADLLAKFLAEKNIDKIYGDVQDEFLKTLK